MKNFILFTILSAAVSLILIAIASFVIMGKMEIEKARASQDMAAIQQNLTNTQAQVTVLSEEIEKLRNELSAQSEKTEKQSVTTDKKEDYRWLAFGNSITQHGVCNYWWNNIGMAASTEEKDYFHLVLRQLEKKHGQVNALRQNIGLWEIQATDRTEVLDVYNDCLKESWDLITLQFGENIQDTTTFAQDCEEMLNHIKTRAPKSRIVMLGNLWERGDCEKMKQAAAKKYGIEYIYMDEIKDNKEYESSIGATVYDAEGNPHKIEHQGVANHPDDRGMQYIADAILKFLE